jgi:hypothetical protein
VSNASHRRSATIAAETGEPRTYIATWILAADPSVVQDGSPITTQVRIPWERWRVGPIGSRVQVVDYDTSTDRFYGRVDFEPARLIERPTAADLESAEYQASNLFATAMATIGQFEKALGRLVGFATDTHQIKVAPHAFVGANAFYDRDLEAVVFGYFEGENGKWVDTSLSYDIIVHELTHAILDGLRPRFRDPSSPDQAAFHEAFADIVAILSTLTRREVMQWALAHRLEGEHQDGGRATLDQILRALSTSFLSAVAPQLGRELGPDMVQRTALRDSFTLLDEADRDRGEGEVARKVAEKKVSPYAARRRREPHELGEVLVAAVLSTFREVLRQRLHQVMPGSAEGEATPIELVADEASRAAELLLTVCIQAIDYTPPVHLTFPDYLSAMLTVHDELYGPEPAIDLSGVLRKSFAEVGVEPATEQGPWDRFTDRLDHSGVRFDQIKTDRDEAFRFVFANWEQLGLHEASYGRVLSVRPSVRVSPKDGFTVHETVVECLERLRLTRKEFRCELDLGPNDVGSGKETDNLDLRGGVTLVLGDHGQVKYVIHKHLVPTSDESTRKAAADRIAYEEHLERAGWVTRQAHPADFAELHRGSRRPGRRAWDAEERDRDQDEKRRREVWW